MQDESHEPAERTLHARVEERSHPQLTRSEYTQSVTNPHTLIRKLRDDQNQLELENRELRLAGEEAQRARTRYEELYELAPVGYYALDTEGQIQEANRVGGELLGTEKALLPRRRFELWVVKEDRNTFHEFLRKTLTETAIRTCKLRMLKSEGTSFPVEIQGIRAPVEGTNRHHICLTVLDVSVPNRLEEESRRTQKLEAIGLLAGGVAHEFNNLLTVILANAELLQTREGGDSPSGGSAHEIVQASLRAANLTRQLLTFSCRQTPHPMDVVMNELLTGVTDRLRRSFGEDIVVESCLAQDLPRVRADPHMVEQAIMILAANSRDAMPHGGRLTITTKLVCTDEAYLQRKPEALLGEFVRTTVRDTGIGIAPSHRVHIFEPFFTTKEVGKGTGLGLASVYGMIKRHSGWIELSSTVGQGTAFHVFLPTVTKPAVSPASARTLPAAKEGRKTVLVVEDAPDVRRMVCLVLKRAGYSVLEAASGAAALKVWQNRRHKVDLLLTDLVMPGGMNGRELAEHLQAENPALNVIYTSGYSAAVLGQNFVLEEGANFLQKPFVPRKLAQAIRRCLVETGDSPQKTGQSLG